MHVGAPREAPDYGRISNGTAFAPRSQIVGSNSFSEDEIKVRKLTQYYGGIS